MPGADEQGELDYAQKCCGAVGVDADVPCAKFFQRFAVRMLHPVLKSASIRWRLQQKRSVSKDSTLSWTVCRRSLSRYLVEHLHREQHV